MNKAEHERLKLQIKSGFLDEDLKPIKCFVCESKEMADSTMAEDGGFVSEFERDCAKCGATLGYWAYGNWQI